MSAPIRVRLTAWYVLVLAVVIAALTTFVVTRLRSDLTSEVDRSLNPAANQIALGYRQEGAKDFRDVVRTVLPVPGSPGAGAQILDDAGRVLLSDGDPVVRAPLLGGAAVARVGRGDRLVRSLHAGDLHLRTVAIPVRRVGRREVVVVAQSLETVDSSVHRVLVLLLVGSAAALALVALGGWWIARKALRAVEQMTSRADRIGIHDLSERIAVPRVRDEVGHLARTLNAMLERLERGVEARERLIADASHELRAPLAAMRSELEVSLRQDDLGPEARVVMASARDEVLRMGRIVENLLTLARVDEGRLGLLVAPHDLRAVADAAVREHRSAAAAAGVDVAVEGDPGPVAVDGDRMQQVVSNLVSNAIRFAPAGSEVRVSLWRDATEVCVTVSDAGPGVPAGERERVFERFARHDLARARDGGAGLGLAISREIVRAHGGRIWVEDCDPRGAAFVVAVPTGSAAPAGPRPERATLRTG